MRTGRKFTKIEGYACWVEEKYKKKWLKKEINKTKCSEMKKGNDGF